MKLIRLNDKQETLVADKIFDLANFIAVGFVITQSISKQPDSTLILLGLLLYAILMVFALWLRR